MKKSYALAFASGLLFLGSCSNDAPEVYPQLDPIDEEGNIGYISFNLQNSDTRADADEETGTADENSIKHIDFLFTGVDNQPFKVNIQAAQIENNKAVVKLPKMPKYVAVVVNGESAQLNNLTDITTQSVSQYCNGSDVNKNFYMSSSRYWDASKNPVYRTNISASQVYKSAEAAKAGSSVSLTVERYVSKVNVSSDITLTDGKINPLTGDHATDVKDGSANAVVTFAPEYVFLTGWNDEGRRVKDLPAWNDMPQELTANNWCNDQGGKRSFWVGRTAGNVKFETLNKLSGNDADGETAKWAKAFGANDVFYPFENKQASYQYKTSVVVAGKYEVKDAAGNSLADTDGTFYLVAFENQFTVCKTEADAVKAMGGAATDVLVPEGANSSDLTAGYTDSSWTGWTGWMKIKGSSNVIRCVKYSGGYGYYSKEIVRTTVDDTPFEALVRNHVYTINLKGISGMGVGIPDPDQPIINIPTPDPSAQNYFLNMSVKVANWRVVPAQDVEWK